MLSFALFVAFVSHTYGETTCPHPLKIEKATNSIIVCKSDNTNAYFYWYKGESKGKDLIGKLEEGLVTVSEQYMGIYDIDLSASLRIRNAGLSHQSLYTLVTFNTNGTSEEDEVTLEITKNVTTCPHKLKIKKGKTFSIPCTTDKSTVAFYWYIESVEEGSLIGKFENGFFTITEQYVGRYSMVQPGSLEIRNAGVLHEVLYILLTFDSDGVQEKDRIYLMIEEPCGSPKPATSGGDVKCSRGTVSGILVILTLTAVL